MSFIEMLMESVRDIIDKFCFSLSEGIDIDDIDTTNWIIGSGSCFNLYLGITHKKAKEIFDSLDVRQCCGTLIDKKSVDYFVIETFHAMESYSGYVHLFMFPVKDVVVDERNNINANLLKFEKWKADRYGSKQ